MKVEKFVLNPWQANTYLLYDETKEAALIDCGCFTRKEENQICEKIDELELILVKLLQTHLHLDHIFGYQFAHEKFGLSACAHKEDEFLLDAFQTHAEIYGINQFDRPPELGRHLVDKELVTFGKTTLQCLHVPGHSPGGICFYNEKEKILFSGDCLFHGSIGRTDLMRGNHDDLVQNIRQKLFALPNETVVYSGHGPETTIGYEKENNPFL